MERHHSRSVDDFAEFLNDAYQPLLDALTRADLHATLCAGPVGFHLSVTSQTSRDHVSAASFSVDITDNGMPLPDAPTDVDVWTLSTPLTEVRIPTATDLSRDTDDAWSHLASTASDLLR